MIRGLLKGHGANFLEGGTRGERKRVELGRVTKKRGERERMSVGDVNE